VNTPINHFKKRNIGYKLKFCVGSLISLSFLICACSIEKHLKKSEYLLGKQTIENNTKIDDSELQALFIQKPNRKLLGYHLYLHSYYWGLNRFDTNKVEQRKKKLWMRYQSKLSSLSDSSLAFNIINKTFDNYTSDSLIALQKNSSKIKKCITKYEKKIAKEDMVLKKGNWLMRAVGEPPSLHDSSASNQNLIYLENYYHNSGYFDTKVGLKLDTNHKYVKEIYTISEGKPYTIGAINFRTSDMALQKLYEENINASLLKPNKIYQEKDLTAERERFYKLCKNNGYFDFTPQYLSFEIDSSFSKKNLNIDFIVATHESNKVHPRYTFQNIYFNHNISEPIEIKDTGYYRNVYFIFSKQNFSKRIVSKKILFKENEYFNLQKIQLTQRNLAMLDMYKFININFEKIKIDSNRYALNTFVRATPLKKFQSTEEAGINMASNFIPGPSGSLNFKSRNTFRGFEIFETSIRATVVGQASIIDRNEFFRSEEYVFQNSLSFPQLFFPITRKIQYKIDNYNPVTRFSSSYTLVRRPEYSRDNINLGMDYNLLLSPQKQLSFSIVDVNLVSTSNKSADFEKYLEGLKSNGNNLLNSFGRALVSSIGTSYTFTNNIMGENKKSKFFRIQIESGGTILNFLSSSKLLKTTDTLLGLKTFRYLKLNTDLRYYFPIGKNTFAMRYHLGIAKAYDQEEVLPYERNFFLGGSNSIRAWAPRRLGPGAWVAERDAQGRPIYRFEQPGSIMFEVSMEYRFKMIKFLEGAIFMDAGNIWIWQPRSGIEKARPEGVFYTDKFLDQIAVGSGLGLRLNFSFLILRFDFGWKVKDPSMEEGKRWVFLDKGYRSPLLNLSIGYPF
jgi:outer membrane protein assembly factor BamA